jgi:tripeptide aminopeptidase
MGLPCPNIFAGGINFHGKFEYTSVETMVKAAETIVKIAEIYAKRPVA